MVLLLSYPRLETYPERSDRSEVSIAKICEVLIHIGRQRCHAVFCKAHPKPQNPSESP